MRNRRGYGSPYELVMSGCCLMVSVVILKILFFGGTISSAMVMAFAALVLATAMISLTL